MKRTLALTSAVATITLTATSATAAPTAGAAPPSSVAASRAEQVHAAMTRDQRIGQLFMVATPADSVSPGLRSVVSQQHVGNVILMGRSTAGADHIRSVTTGVQRLTEPTAATAGVPAFVSADQEGGNVQVLRGPGYSTMPTALTQGRWTTTTLRSQARSWGLQLSRSGVNTNLAPVLDTVPTADKSTNEPIGRWDREYGALTTTVTTKGGAVRSGMSGAGVATTVKHFPGLGRVRGNTDTTSGVTDTVTTSTSGVLRPFADAVDAGTPFVMMSSAYYSRIDASQPALFSPTVIGTILRQRMGFDGIVMTDDVGNAKQLAAWTPGQRATKFISAGGDMVLTASTDSLPAMVSAVRSKAASDPAFRAKVDAAALRVLRAKDQAGMLGTRLTPTGTFTPYFVERLQGWLGKPVTRTWDTATIRSLQWRIGATTTGRWDAASMRALQDYLGISRDGATRWNSRTVAQVQRYLNTQL